MKIPLLELIRYGMYVALAGELVYYLVVGNEHRALYTALNAPALVAPWYLVRRWKIPAPTWLVSALTVFIFLSPFLGSALGFYEAFSWWDDILHSTWGILGVVAGFIALHMLRAATDRTIIKQAGFYSLFAFSFSVMTSVLWEIFEFVYDMILSANSQQGGWPDTMYDLCTSTSGALLAAVYAYFLIKKYRRLPFVEQ